METHPALVALETVRTQRQGSFAILVVDRERNYYAQFTADETPGIYAEVVGNDYLEADDQLSAFQHAEMRARGWDGDGSVNWSRQWAEPTSERDLQRIVFETLNDLAEVYGADGEVDVEVTVEGTGAGGSVATGNGGVPPAPQSSRILLAAAVAVTLLVLAVFVLSLAACSLTGAERTEVFYIAAETTECVGEGVQQCLLLRRSPTAAWELFYDSIEGYQHESGVAAVIEVDVRSVPEPPADGSRLAYRLVRVIERTPAWELEGPGGT